MGTCAYSDGSGTILHATCCHCTNSARHYSNSTFVSSPVATMNEHEEPVVQDPIEPVVTHKEEQQQPHIEQVSTNETPRRPQRVRRSVIPDNYKVYECEEFQIEGEPTSFEEAMRSTHSSKWLEAMQDEIRSMNTNGVWDLEIIPKEAKTVGCKWVYKIKHDSKGNI